jgi:hypothetical protein
MSDTAKVPPKAKSAFVEVLRSRIVRTAMEAMNRPDSSWARVRSLTASYLSAVLRRLFGALLESALPLMVATAAIAEASSGAVAFKLGAALLAAIGLYQFIASFIEAKKRKGQLAFQDPKPPATGGPIKRLKRFFGKPEDASSIPPNCHSSYKGYARLRDKEQALWCAYMIYEHVVRARWSLLCALGGAAILGLGLIGMESTAALVGALVAVADLAMTLFILPILRTVFEPEELARYLKILEVSKTYMKPIAPSDSSTEFRFVENYLSRMA